MPKDDHSLFDEWIWRCGLPNGEKLRMEKSGLLWNQQTSKEWHHNHSTQEVSSLPTDLKTGDLEAK